MKAKTVGDVRLFTVEQTVTKGKKLKTIMIEIPKGWTKVELEKFKETPEFILAKKELLN
jgi:hypothetical protein